MDAAGPPRRGLAQRGELGLLPGEGVKVIVLRQQDPAASWPRARAASDLGLVSVMAVETWADGGLCTVPFLWHFALREWKGKKALLL